MRSFRGDAHRWARIERLLNHSRVPGIVQVALSRRDGPCPSGISARSIVAACLADPIHFVPAVLIMLLVRAVASIHELATLSVVGRVAISPAEQRRGYVATLRAHGHRLDVSSFA